jgi:uncharacterized protein YciW
MCLRSGVNEMHHQLTTKQWPQAAENTEQRTLAASIRATDEYIYAALHLTSRSCVYYKHARTSKLISSTSTSPLGVTSGTFSNLMI